MATNSDFFNSVYKTANFFGLSEKRLRSFSEGFVRGSFWLVLWALILAIPLFIYFFIVLEDSSSQFDEFSASVVASILQTAGGFSSGTAVGGVLDNSKFFLDVALRPTALTLILALSAYKRGRTRQALESTDKGSENTSLFYALGLGTGFATLATISTFFVSGIVSSVSFLSLAPASVLSWFSMVAVLAIPSWLGGLRESGSKRATSPWRWFYSALRTFAVLYASLIVLALIAIWLYFLIAPAFTLSTPTLEPTASAKLSDEQTRVILLAILGIILVLPTILFSALCFGLGANIGLKTEVQGINILDALTGFIPSDYLGALGNVNLESAFGWPAMAGAALIIAIAALVAGAAAAHKTNAFLNFKRHFLITLFATAASAGALTYLSSLTITWTNKGKSTEELTDGALALQSGLISYGITAASLILICGLVAVFATLGASAAKEFTSSAFPKVLSWLSLRRSAHAEPRDLGALIFGTVVTVAVFAAAAAPVGVASIERAWAVADAPTKKFDELANLLQSGDLAELKKRFANNETDKRAWLPDQALESARPTGAMNKSTELRNSNGNNWSVGELDAVGVVSWKIKEKEEIRLRLDADGEVQEHFQEITHADYKVRKPYLTLSVAAGEFMTPTGKTNLKVNGQGVVPGIYNAIPGKYVVTTDAYKLVAASKTILATNSSANEVVAEEKPSLKPEYEKVLVTDVNRLAEECSKFTEISKSNCFTLEDIYNSRRDNKQTAPSAFFGFQTNNFKVGGFKCEGESTDTLLSAVHVARKAACSVEMTFAVDYFKSKAEVRKLSRQESYNGCPEFGDAPCNRSRTISLGSETVEVRGDKIGSADFTSSVPFYVNTIGYLDAKDKFSIVKNFVKPTYKPVETVVVKPVPVKKEFVVLGYFVTLDELKYVVKNPKLGDAYAVTPARITYVWSGKQWLAIG